VTGSGPVSPEPEPKSTPAPKPASPLEETATQGVEEPNDFSKLPSLDVDSEMARLAEPEPEAEKKDGAAGAASTGPRARRTGAGRKEYVSSVEKQRRAMLRYGIGALVLGGVAAAYFAEGEKVQKEGEAKVGGLERLKNNASEFLDVSWRAEHSLCR
jgi:import inner membrane translocase subunit TIM50